MIRNGEAPCHLLFNSHIYLLLFLPLCWLGYFALNRQHLTRAATGWLAGCSLLYYAWWRPPYLALILASMLVNYLLGRQLGRAGRPRRGLLVAGIALNLLLLGYFKYADFAIDNLNRLLGTNLETLRILLPLAISFFTFQQIAYLVDSYRRQTTEYSFGNYCLFVCFFPQLIAGPIVHHAEMMPQFARLRHRLVNPENLYRGLVLLAIGLFKKVVVADTFAVWATSGFDKLPELGFLPAWTAVLSYTCQIYYDFSGYTDMAVGSALLFNIELPLNFNSPYQAISIQDFWRRWHMTLSRWLRDYLFIPLGGSRQGQGRTCLNLFLVFLLGGLWHGAGWTFVIWGAMHGLATVVHRLWSGAGRKLPAMLGWAVTFLFVVLTWVFFRARDFAAATKLLRGMFLGNGSGWLPGGKTLACLGGDGNPAIWLGLFLALAFLAPNSMRLKERVTPRWTWAVAAALLAAYAILSISRVSEFLYFQF